jgi:hypothetical protein
MTTGQTLAVWLLAVGLFVLAGVAKIYDWNDTSGLITVVAFFLSIIAVFGGENA